jgi:hypothetical protein
MANDTWCYQIPGDKGNIRFSRAYRVKRLVKAHDFGTGVSF